MECQCWCLLIARFISQSRPVPATWWETPAPVARNFQCQYCTVARHSLQPLLYRWSQNRMIERETVGSDDGSAEARVSVWDGSSECGYRYGGWSLTAGLQWIIAVYNRYPSAGRNQYTPVSTLCKWTLKSRREWHYWNRKILVSWHRKWQQLRSETAQSKK